MNKHLKSRVTTKIALVAWKAFGRKKEHKAQSLLHGEPDKFVKLMFTNPVIVAQANNELLFEPDYLIGHILPRGKEFIGRNRFLSFGEIVDRIKFSGKKVILNIGDSSTSGWESYIVVENKERRQQGKPIILPFFHYMTYSDQLAEMLEDFIVINAGVPAHTSFQGARRLEELLIQFNEVGVSINFVTAYYGNNDSVWNGNVEDIDLLPSDGSEAYEELKHAFFDESVFMKLAIAKQLRGNALRVSRDDIVVTRTSPMEYGRSILRILELCRMNGAIPILIEPQTPLYWEPGKRIVGEELPEIRNRPGSELVYSLLDNARSIWSEGLEGCSDKHRIAVLKRARELDYIIPRIKEKHLIILRKVAKKTGTPFVQPNPDRAQDDEEYFLDYCHPNEKANLLIAKGIAKVIQETEEFCACRISESFNQFRQRPKKQSFLGSAVRFLDSLFGKGNEENFDSIPTDIYTLY
jgi:lysophospholipase L1-like esterase